MQCGGRWCHLPAAGSCAYSSAPRLLQPTMLSALARPAGASLRRSVSTSAQNNAKVAVLGASGGIGQPLVLLLKNSPLGSRLTLWILLIHPEWPQI